MMDVFSYIEEMINASKADEPMSFDVSVQLLLEPESSNSSVTARLQSEFELHGYPNDGTRIEIELVGNKFKVVKGKARAKAAINAGLKTIPAYCDFNKVMLSKTKH